MLFDQQKLAPSFGYIFDLSWLDIHDSLLSILWKFIKMNGVPGPVVLRLLAKTDIDPYDGMLVNWPIDRHRWVPELKNPDGP